MMVFVTCKLNSSVIAKQELILSEPRIMVDETDLRIVETPSNTARFFFRQRDYQKEYQFHPVTSVLLRIRRDIKMHTSKTTQKEQKSCQIDQ